MTVLTIYEYVCVYKCIHMLSIMVHFLSFLCVFSHFGYFDLNETVIDFESQDIYKKDLIGLKTLDKSGRLHVITVPGVDHFMWHLNVSIVDDYLLKFLD